MKFVLWLLLILVVLHLLRKKKAGLAASMRAAASESAQRQGDVDQPIAGEAMLPCAYCGVHVPQSESVPAVAKLGQVFCSEAHRRLYREL